MMTKMTAGFLTAALLAGASPALAASVHAGPHRALLSGQVTGLTAGGFTLTRTNRQTGAVKTFAVSLTPATTEVAAKGVTGPLTNGEYALVVGTRTGTTISAIRIRYSTRPLRLGLRAGTVTSQTPSSITVLTLRGRTLQIGITDTTKFRVNGQVAQTVPTLTNQHVVVRVRRDPATKSLVALVVIERAPKA